MYKYIVCYSLGIFCSSLKDKPPADNSKKQKETKISINHLGKVTTTTTTTNPKIIKKFHLMDKFK